MIEDDLCDWNIPEFQDLRYYGKNQGKLREFCFCEMNPERPSNKQAL